MEKANLCKCNNCNTILIDKNPQVDAPEYYITGKEEEMHLKENQPEPESKDAKIEYYWACPVCNTDEYLTDLQPIDNYVREIQEAVQARYDKLNYTIPVPKYSVSTGAKFYKVIELNHSQKSVHCFVEIATGDIYKPAGWSVPAKGVRGNINAENKPLLCRDYYR